MAFMLLRYASSLRSAHLVLLIAIPASLTFLLLFPFGLACGILALLSFFLTLRSWHLLLALVQRWLWRLPMILNFRASLWWGGWA